MTFRTWFGAVALTAIAGCTADLPSSNEDAELAGTNEQALAASVSAKKVCFTTHVLGASVPTTGTLYTRAGYDADTNVVLLLHGLAANRTFFDGGPNAPEGSPSFARELARRGYAALAIDRPGYGESQYPDRFGVISRLNTSFVQIDAIHEVVSALHAGTYTETTGDCPSGKKVAFGSRRVTLSGYSGGGGLTEGYALKYGDIEAAIPMVWSNQGLSLQVLKTFLANQLLPQLKRSQIPNWKPGPNGVSEECKHALFYEPGADPEVVRRVCANENLLPTPAGEVDSAAFLQETNKVAIKRKKIGATPILLVFADRDTDFPGKLRAKGEKDLTTPEIALWKNHCGCDVTSYVQPNSGHDGVLHDSMPELVKTIDGWLTARGLGGDR